MIVSHIRESFTTYQDSAEQKLSNEDSHDLQSVGQYLAYIVAMGLDTGSYELIVDGVSGRGRNQNPGLTTEYLMKHVGPVWVFDHGLGTVLLQGQQ